MKILSVTLDPGQFFQDDHTIEVMDLPLEECDDEEEINDLIGEEVLALGCGSGFGRYGLSFNKEQAQKLLIELNKFLENE